MKRTRDWFGQAKAFLDDAKRNHEAGSWYIGCFLSQQSAEFSIKALCQHLGVHCWGHNLLELLQNLSAVKEQVKIDDQIDTACKILNKYYISTRYPDAYPSGSPHEQFSAVESVNAIKLASEVMGFVARHLEASDIDHQE